MNYLPEIKKKKLNLIIKLKKMGGGGRNKLYTNSSKRTLNPMDKYRKKLKMKEKEKVHDV